MNDKKQYNQSAYRTIKILEMLLKEKKKLSLTEISKKLDIHKSIAFRLLSVLEEENWVDQDNETKKYNLGIKLLSFNSFISKELNFAKIARPAMEKLSSTTGETVVLILYKHGKGICIEKVESNKSLKITADIGEYFPLYAGGTGLSLLLGMEDEEIKKILNKNNFIKFTDNTPKNSDEVLRIIKKGREKGYIYSDSMVDENIVSIGIPLFIKSSNIYCSLSVIGPNFRLKIEEKENVVSNLYEARREILNI